MYISHPVTRYKIFLDNSLTEYEKRLQEVLTKALTPDIITYCEDNAKIKSKSQILSYEYAERLLENCATFLLQGQLDKNNILTLNKIRRNYRNEIPASISDSNAEDLIYGTNSFEEDVDKSLTASPDLVYNTDIGRDELVLSQKEVNRYKKKQEKQKKRYRSTSMYRMEKLFPTKVIRTYRLKQVHKNIDGKDVPVKNVFGQPVYEAVYLNIGGRMGMIDENTISKWCIVDSRNVFTFDGITFVINDSVVQYAVGKDNESKMDKIFCVKKNEKYIFFDQNVVKLPAKMVERYKK